MIFLYAALLISFLLVGCSKEPKEDELMLTPIEDSGFSYDVEQDDGDVTARAQRRIQFPSIFFRKRFRNC